MLVMVGGDVEVTEGVGMVGVELGRTGALVWQAPPITAQHKMNTTEISLAILMELIIPTALPRHNPLIRDCK